MASRLCIVSRRHPELYAYLRRRFAADDTVTVILDRRRAQRRQPSLAVRPSRRVADRRSRPEVDARLRIRSHMIVTIETPAP